MYFVYIDYIKIYHYHIFVSDSIVVHNATVEQIVESVKHIGWFIFQIVNRFESSGVLMTISLIYEKTNGVVRLVRLVSESGIAATATGDHEHSRV